MDPNPTSDDESSDSFYSFNSSGIDYGYECGNPIWDGPMHPSDSDTETEHETSGPLEVQESTKPLSLEECLGIPKPPPLGGQKSECCNGVSTSEDAQQQKKVEDSPPNRTEESLSVTSSQMPSLEHLNLDSPQPRVKDYLTPDPEKEAMQKIAFTEIWVNWQMKYSESDRSPPEFSAALDAYFKPSANPIVQPIMEAANAIVKN